MPLPSGRLTRGATRRRVLRALAAAAPALVLAGHALASGQDPFGPGLRWTRAASASDAWIPRSVAFGAGDNAVFAAATGSAAHLELDAAHAMGRTLPLARDDQFATAISVLSVAAGHERDAFFSVAQFPFPDATHRRTEVMRHAPFATGSMPATTWTYAPSAIVNGPARIACDERGACVAIGLWDDAAHAVSLDVIDGASGALAAHATLAGANLSEVAMSPDGARIAVAAGLDLWILDAQAAVLHHRALASSTRALSFAGDGRKLAVGGVASLAVLEESPGGAWSTSFTIVGAGNEIASRAELARDGSTLAIGWWNYVSGVDLRLEVFDVASRARVWDRVQNGTPGGLQNLPEVVRVSDDGRRVALGAWGDGSTTPELLLFDRASPLPVLSADLPGSVQALALDASGTRVAVGLKNAHANQFATTGQVRLYETGEADVAVLGQPMVGGTLAVAAKKAGATQALFLLGPRAPQPIVVPGTEGELRLRRTRLAVFPAPTDASGRADLVLPLPNDPALRGTQWHVQAGFVVNGVLVFSDALAEPYLL